MIKPVTLPYHLKWDIGECYDIVHPYRIINVELNER
jgi:hypothetical protein